MHAVVGAQFGDEGKGKMVDYFAAEADLVVRYQGGGNAGHTIVNEYGKFALHLVPSGIFHPQTVCVLGAGVVIHPTNLLRELDVLEQAGIPTERLVISERAHLVLPWHIWQDQMEEQARARKVGTTLQGVGPTYQDKVGRFGLQMGEMLDKIRFRERLESTWEAKLARLPGLASFAKPFAEVWQELEHARERLLPYIIDTLPLLREAIGDGKRVLLEGQLGVMRDLDWGVYPYVTSSSPIAGGIAAGAGIPPAAITRVTGITKAYATAVGAGPFPTQLDDDAGAHLQARGEEFGATTGRVRQCGWLDIPTLRYGAWLNGYTDFALMKLDVLSGLPEVKLCIAYEGVDGREQWPRPAHEMEKLTPVYESWPGWESDLSACRRFPDLPREAQVFVDRIEAESGVPIRYVSVGPDRAQTIIRG